MTSDQKAIQKQIEPNPRLEITTRDGLGACAAAAMAEIRISLSRLTPAERAAFWHAVDLLYRAPTGSPMSMKEPRSIQNGIAEGLNALFPPG